MKKFISAFLSVVMLLSFAMGMNLTVFADDSKTIVSASLTPIKPYTIYEGAYGYYDDGVGYYWAPDFNAGDIINITFSDETKATYTYYNQYEYQGWHTSNNDEISVVGYSFYADKLGKTYVSYCINDFDFDIENVPVTIVNNPVESFSLTPAKAYEIIECTHGRYLDEENETDWLYYAPDFNEGDKITVNYTDGTSEEYTYKENRAVEFGYFCDFVNTKNEILKFESYGFELDGTGETTFEVKLPDYGKTTNVPVTIIENPIFSFSFTPIKEYTVIENSGEMDDEECYYDAPDFNDGDKITVNYTNGTSDVFIYVKNSDYFFNEKNETIAARGYGFFYTGTGKTTFDVVLSDYNKSINVPVSVVENPVESFSLTPVKAYEVTEGTDGYYSDEENETDWYYHSPAFEEGDKITVNYTDGTSEEFVYKKGGESWDFVNDDNEILNVDRYGFELDGTGETTFIVKLSDYGKTINVPVTVVESPVESFSLTPVKAYEVTEGTDGYYSDEENETDWYYHSPAFEEGDKITVNYTDGTSEEFVYKKGGESWDFVNDDNEILNVESYVFKFDGTGKTTFEVKLPDYGKTINVPVTVVAKSSGGSTSDGGSTSGGGSTGGGGAAPAPAPTTDDSQKTEEQKPTTSITTTTTTETQKPATVKVSKTTAKKNGVVVTWKTAKDVTGYEIQLATDKKFKKNKKTVKVNKKNASKKTVKKLKSKKKYYVRVRSYKIVNGKKVYGKWSKVKSVKTK